MATTYIVRFTAIGGINDLNQSLSEGHLVTEQELKRAGYDVDRLIQIGAIETATEDEKKLGEARAIINDALQAAPGSERAQELADQRALAERTIAEPPASLQDGATVPNEANQTVPFDQTASARGGEPVPPNPQTPDTGTPPADGLDDRTHAELVAMLPEEERTAGRRLKKDELIARLRKG